ncbi:MAG: O-antigen ligase family protein [Desulfohalobiaceae bacterium]|nr:O-antigen ligase family protein [Desulfohalobiaceae bacterium]
MSNGYALSLNQGVDTQSEPALTLFPPQFLYYAIIFTIPYYQWRSISDAYFFLKVDWLLVLGLIALIIPMILVRKKIPESLQSNLWPWLILFFLANLISSLVSPYRGAAFSEVFNTLIIGYIFIGLNLLMISEKGFTRIMPVVLAWSIGLNSFIGILQYFFDYMPFGGQIAERGRGLTIGANNMALMCVFTLPILVHWALHARNRKSALLAVLLLIVNILGVISSESRGGFLAMLIVGFLIILEVRHRFHPRYLGLVIALFSMFCIAFIAFTPEAYFERQSTILEGSEADKSTRRRTDYLLVGLKSFVEHPVLGTGTLTFDKTWVRSEKTRKYDLTERPAHNTYMEILVGTGLLGGIFFALLLLQGLYNFSRAKLLFTENGNQLMASLAGAYRISLLAVFIYFLFKSGLDHKLFLLALPLSQVALDLASLKPQGKPVRA